MGQDGPFQVIHVTIGWAYCGKALNMVITYLW